MGLIAKETGGGERVLCPPGTYPARCVQVVDLGTQHSEKFNNKRHEVRLTWELPTQRHVFNEDKGEEPFLLSRRFTLSLNRKSSLFGFLMAWRGRAFTDEELRGFDVSCLLGAPCLLTVVHSDNGEYANVQAAAKLPKGMDCPEPITPKICYDISQGKDDAYNSFPDFLKDLIGACEEWKTNGSVTQTAPTGGSADPDDDDIPF